MSENEEKIKAELEARILAQVPVVLEDIQKRPNAVMVSHAKILAHALKVEEHRVEEATHIGQKIAEAQREHAAKCFDELLTSGDSSEARERFLELLGPVHTNHIDQMRDRAIEAFDQLCGPHNVMGHEEVRARFLEKLGVKL